MTNPSLPPGYIYTPYYCEENIYLLAQSLADDQSINDKWETYAVFLSNHSKSVALWNQKISTNSDHPVIWDYHCILLLKPKLPHHHDHGELEAWVVDYDSRLAVPCLVQEYIEGTLGNRSFQFKLGDRFQCMFRVVSSTDYLENFVSDRSHMIQVDADGSQTYIHPPPLYPCIIGQRVKDNNTSAAVIVRTNLMDGFVSMSPSTIGNVMTFSQFCQWMSIEVVDY